MPQRTARWVLGIACMAFIALGCFNASVGPLLPEYAVRTGSQLAAVGALFSALSLGGLLTTLVCGPVSDRFGQRVILLAGLLIMPLGLSGLLASRSLLALLGFATVSGIGTSAVSFGGNLLVAITFGRRNTTALNLLHLCFSLGAVLGPAVVSLGLILWSTGWPAVGLSILIPVALFPACLTLRVPPPERSSGGPAAGPSIYGTLLVWVFAAFLGVSVGVQIGMGGWATTYLTVTTGMPIAMAALMTSGYWLAQSLGRLIVTLVSTRLNPYTILAVDVAGGCLAGFALLLSMGQGKWTVGAILLMGFSFGSIYPTTVALATATFRSAPGKAASVIMSTGSLATLILPWLQGALLSSFGPASTPWFATVGCVLMAILLAGITRSAARAPAQA